MRNWLKKVYVDPEFRRKEQFLQHIPLFERVPRREFGRLFHALAVRDYAVGDELFHEGDVSRALFILESGEVGVTNQGKDGEVVPMTTLKAGSCFGEIALIDYPRMATVTAVTPVRAYLLYKTELEKLMEDAPHVAAAILAHSVAVMGEHLRALLRRMAITSPEIKP